MRNYVLQLLRRINRQRKLRKLLKTALGRDAFTALINSLKIDGIQAYKLLGELVEFDDANLKVLLRCICQGSRDGFVGNPACEFNARSAYLRCAVNPSGPCLGCKFSSAASGVDWG